jgi:hypothetical protein
MSNFVMSLRWGVIPNARVFGRPPGLQLGAAKPQAESLP